MNDVSLMSSGKSVRLLQCALFLFVWFVFGLAINTANLDAFKLQQAGVESLVERHQFSLEGSAAPQLQIKVYYDGDKPFGDTFMYNGRQYAAKQPGQFMLGAVVFFVLRLFGLSYVTNYTLTSALVTFFTASLATAIAAIAVFRTVRLLTGNKSVAWPLTVALLFAFGTTAFVYSGVAHHDAIASSYLVIAFYLAALLAHGAVEEKRVALIAAIAGFFVGLTVTTSMLPFFMACVLGTYLVWLARWRRALAVIVGGLAGIAPLLLYNAKAFGNPLLNANIAGGYPDSYLHLSLHNFLAKAQLYFSEITLYDPLVWLGIAGLVFLPGAFRRERWIIAALFVVHVFQVLNIDTHGGCHYGPRFLLPLLPFATVALTGFYFLRTRTKRLAVILIAVVGLVSVAINAVGAFSGAMYCEVQLYAVWPALRLLRNSGHATFPLMRWLIVPALLSLVVLLHTALHQESNPRLRN
jgi:hypothetical protein